MDEFIKDQGFAFPFADKMPNYILANQPCGLFRLFFVRTGEGVYERARELL